MNEPTTPIPRRPIAQMGARTHDSSLTPALKSSAKGAEKSTFKKERSLRFVDVRIADVYNESQSNSKAYQTRFSCQSAVLNAGGMSDSTPNVRDIK